MAIHELAGKPAPREMLIDVDALVAAYYDAAPDPENPAQRVAFGTSGHRGSSRKGSFNEAHILAMSQAICDYRAQKGYTGPLYMGMDTHALSGPAHDTALEVFAANGITVMIQRGRGFTPTPVISHAILAHNRGRMDRPADGVVVTPSHNPPEDGGFKYNPPEGGPADTSVTAVIEARANEILKTGLKGVKRISQREAMAADTTREYDFVTPYIRDLASVVDLHAVAAAKVRIGVDPLGGSSLAYWEPIAGLYDLDLTVVNDKVDPTFGFMSVDGDGKIRMDCSSPYAMAGLLGLRASYDVAFGNDPDADRHGIVTPAGLMNPNHYLAVAIDYLFATRTGWSPDARIGKTVVTSAMVDRVAAALGRKIAEVPVGFKWFVDGLLNGGYGFGGEESAGASFLRLDGTAWTTDKDGLLLNLLAAEITATTGKNPAEHYAELENRFGAPIYERLQAPADAAQKAVLKRLSPEQVAATTMAGEPILEIQTKAPGNGESIGGLKVVTENAWFAARPSGTEDIYKIYTESFKGAEHLKLVQQEAQAIVDAALGK